MPTTTLPTTFHDAVEVGLSAMSTAQRHEFESVGYFADPHTRYATDFDRAVAEALGLWNGSNETLVRSLSMSHPKAMSWLEEVDGMYSVQGALAVVLKGIEERLRG